MTAVGYLGDYGSLRGAIYFHILDVEDLTPD